MLIKKSFTHLNVSHASGGIKIKNNSANWITIPELIGGSKINKETLLLAPWSEKMLSTTAVVSDYKVTLIDDYGNYLSERIETEK